MIDSEQIYAQSDYAQSIRTALDAEAQALSLENDRIVAALTEEERSLTERRPNMTPTAFRAEADAFDAKVQDIRRARDAKEVALQNARGTAREQFFEQTRGIIGSLMIDRGGSVILDRRTVFLALSAIDITTEAVALIDETLMVDDAAPPATELTTPEPVTDDAFTQPQIPSDEPVDNVAPTDAAPSEAENVDNPLQ